MFLETPDSNKRKKGWIEVICGSMFSGKTEELIRRLKRAQFAKQRIEIFKPAIDLRYDKEKVISHDLNEINSTPVASSSKILELIDEVDVIGIDEAQFSTMNFLIYALLLQKMVCASLLQGLTWTILETLLAPFLI